MAFKEGHRRWDRMVAKKELEEVDEAAEIWNWLRGKASKIDFSDLSDGELNLIAAGLFREQQKRELGEQYEPPRPSGSPRVRENGAIGTHGSPEAGAPQGGALGRTPVEQQGASAQEEQQQWEQQRGRQRGPRRIACQQMRCHWQSGRQGRTTGLQRGSWMMSHLLA